MGRIRRRKGQMEYTQTAGWHWWLVGLGTSALVACGNADESCSGQGCTTSESSTGSDEGTGASGSDSANACGDQTCDDGETPSSCPADCADDSCGDDVCAADETVESCPVDCGYCGDGFCAEPDEDGDSCQEDCGSCGDGTCTSPESLRTCPMDCEADRCGDGTCDAEEMDGSCPADCDVEGMDYTLWIHGRMSASDDPTPAGNYDDFSYWGPTDVPHGVNPIAVNWGGHDPIGETQDYVLAALDCFCTGPNWCHIAVHSTGDLQIGMALATHGHSERMRRNAVPDGSGVCGSTGGTQTGWNIYDVWVAGGVSGGSDLAGIDNPVEPPVPLDIDLSIAIARGMYDHNDTAGHAFHRYAGSSGTTATAGLLPGEDDGAVAYHSSGGLSVWGAYCNPGDNFCGGPTEPYGTLQLGSLGSLLSYPDDSEVMVEKWTNHRVEFRDDQSDYTHFGEGDWQGIIGRMLTDVVAVTAR